MSKKVKEPSTPESRAEKLAHKQMLRKAFTSTFFKAFAVCLSILLVYSIVYISLVNPSRLQMSAVDGNAAQNAVVPNNNNVSSNGSASSDGSSDAAATPTVTELTDTSSQADILAYFNTAINKVKPNAKQITLNSEVNSTAGGISGNLPGTLTSMADGLIADNMGPKDLSSLDPGLVNATTTDQKNAMFRVKTKAGPAN